MNYFAYGSNMSLRRLAARVPSARFVATGRLSHHQLRFHKPSSDGSSKCDAYETGEPQNFLWGVLFNIAAQEVLALDEIEGRGVSYEQKWVAIETPDLSIIAAMTYCALITDASALPYSWYRHHLLIGAQEHELPEHYLQTLRHVDHQPDPNRLRQQQEMAIYTRSTKKHNTSGKE
jgi:gamma-glutamylcyclotransferase